MEKVELRQKILELFKDSEPFTGFSFEEVHGKFSDLNKQELLYWIEKMVDDNLLERTEENYTLSKKGRKELFKEKANEENSF